MPQISTVQVPCFVIQYDNTLVYSDNGALGRVLQVPCRSDFQDNPNYWFVPIKDSGILSGFTPVPRAKEFYYAPTFDSIPVFRVRDKLSGTTWWIYGTVDNFTNSCSTCCGSAAINMPGINGEIVLTFAPCSTLCETDTNGNYIYITALPTLVGSEKYFPYGSYQNVALPAASGAGYATPAALLVFLNATWKHVGSPDANFTWTLSADNLTLTATGGFLKDSLCVVIATVGAST